MSRGYVCLSNGTEPVSIKTRILARLVSARNTDEWLSARSIAKTMTIRRLGTIYKTLKRLSGAGLVARRRVQPAKGRWYWVYQATEHGQARLAQGGLPRGSEKEETYNLDVMVSSLSDILDTDRIKFEQRQVTLKLDPHVTTVLRSACDPPRKKPKKKDRANQLTYSTEAFVITIPHTGNAVLILRDWQTWDQSMSQWMQRAGLSERTSESVLKQVWNQIPGGTTRAEIPVLEQAIRRLRVDARVATFLRKNGEIYAEVESNINYSMNDIGLEYFGTTRWVDAIIRVLIGLQHSALVSEAARDQWIEDALEAVERLRRERESKLVREQEVDYIV